MFYEGEFKKMTKVRIVAKGALASSLGLVAKEPRVLSYAGGDTECKGDLYLPEAVTDSTTKILLIHGGGWQAMDRSSTRGVAEMFRDNGYVVYNIDYRLAPEHPWPAPGDDCLQAADFLVRADREDLSGLRGKPIMLCGLSAGGHLALMTGLRMPREQVKGIISISGIADPDPDRKLSPERYQRLFHGKEFDPKAFPGEWLAKDTPPILLTHQYDDTVVPVWSSIRFARQASNLGCQIFTYYYDRDRKGEGHAIWQPDKAPKQLYSDLAEECLRFLRRCEGRPEPLFNQNGMKYLGQLKRLRSDEVQDSIVSIGFECLDRDMFDPEACYDKLAEVGVKWARVQTGWCKCEQQKGVYNFIWLDRIVDNLIRRGIKPWFNVGYGNKLYMKDTYGEASVGFVPLYYGEECLTAWKNYCRALAGHYLSRVAHYEIWNEPNIPCFWQPKGASPQDYARLIDLTQKEIRGVQPSAKIGGCISGYQGRYLQEFADAGILGKIDFFSLHPYVQLPEQDWAQSVAYLKRKFTVKEAQKVVVWQGESGFASWCPPKYWQRRFLRESERAQAVWLLRRYIVDHAESIPLSSFFQMADMMEKNYQMGESTQNAFSTARMGILNGLTYTPKRAYFALANITALFRDGIRPVEAYMSVFLADAPQGQQVNVGVRTHCFLRGSNPVYVYYVPADPQLNWEPLQNASVTLMKEEAFALMEDPVLVDLLNGGVFNLNVEKTGDMLSFCGLPLTDYPLVICDRSNIRLLQ